MINKIEKFRLSQMNQEEINKRYLQACKEGDMPLLRYLLTTHKTKADIHYKDNQGIIEAAYEKQNEVVKYLIDSKELTSHISIDIKKGYLLNIATAFRPNKELMDFLLNHKSKRLHLNQSDDQIFKYLMSNFNANKDIVKSLIVDYKLIETSTISQFLEEKNRNIDQKMIVKSWFEVRELNNYLVETLESSTSKLKRMKI